MHTERLILTARDGKIILPKQPRNFESIFVYDMGHSKQTKTALNDNILEGEFAEKEAYFVFFEVEEPAHVYSLDTPRLPYFSMEIELKGNVDKKPGCGFICFDAVSLQATPSLDIAVQDVENSTLRFNPIYTN